METRNGNENYVKAKSQRFVSFPKSDYREKIHAKTGNEKFIRCSERFINASFWIQALPILLAVLSADLTSNRGAWGIRLPLSLNIVHLASQK